MSIRVWEGGPPTDDELADDELAEMLAERDALPDDVYFAQAAIDYIVSLEKRLEEASEE